MEEAKYFCLPLGKYVEEFQPHCFHGNESHLPAKAETLLSALCCFQAKSIFIIFAMLS